MFSGYFGLTNLGRESPFEPRGMYVIPAQARLAIPDSGRVVAITAGTGVIERLPPWAAYKDAVVLIFKDQVTLRHSDYLVLNSGEDQIAEPDDLALAIPTGGGRWTLKYGLNADSASWVGYVPTVTPASGSFSTLNRTGRYKRRGNKLDFAITADIISNGTAAGIVSASLPSGVTAAFAQPISGSTETGGVIKGIAGKVSSGTASISLYDGNYAGGTGAVIRAFGSIEITG